MVLHSSLGRERLLAQIAFERLSLEMHHEEMSVHIGMTRKALVALLALVQLDDGVDFLHVILQPVLFEPGTPFHKPCICFTLSVRFDIITSRSRSNTK